MAAEDAAGAQQNFVDDAVAKTKETYEKISETVGGALNSDQAEKVTDSILDTVSDFAKKVLPDEADAKIDEVRKQVDDALGRSPPPAARPRARAETGWMPRHPPLLHAGEAGHTPDATRPGLRHARAARRLVRFHIPACARPRVARRAGSLPGQCIGRPRST